MVAALLGERVAGAVDEFEAAIIGPARYGALPGAASDGATLTGTVKVRASIIYGERLKKIRAEA